jgi:tetratricopeptide (TPR) repeat protein
MFNFSIIGPASLPATATGKRIVSHLAIFSTLILFVGLSGVGLEKGFAQSNFEQLHRLEARATVLESEIRSLNGRLRRLECLEQRWVVYGAVDEHRLVDHWFWQDSERIGLESSRPGIFKFVFEAKLLRKPMIVVTFSNKWGDIKIDLTSARVADVSEGGFTVETFRASDPADVAFTFVVVRGAAPRRMGDRVQIPDCSGLTERIRRISPSDGSEATDREMQRVSQAISTDSNDSAALRKRSQLLMLKRSFSDAIQDLDEVLLRRPKDPEALNNRCWARAILGDFQSALRDCEDALSIRPEYADVLDTHGFINLKMGRLADAIQDYDRALSINPRQAFSLYGRGMAKIKSGNRTGGVPDVEAAKALNPKIAEEFATYGVY